MYYDDWHVWVVANALRRGLDVAPKSHLQAKYEPALGVFVDLVCGGIGTALICVALAEAGFNFRSELWENRGSVARAWRCSRSTKLALTVWEIARHKLGGDAAGEVKIALGMRGLGLFLLLFVVVMIHDALGSNNAVARGVIADRQRRDPRCSPCFNAVGFLWRPRRDELAARASCVDENGSRSKCFCVTRLSPETSLPARWRRSNPASSTPARGLRR